jgi:hypothetical protein
MLKAAKAWDSEELRVLLAGVTLLCSRVKLCMLMFGLGAINPKVELVWAWSGRSIAWVGRVYKYTSARAARKVASDVLCRKVA